MEKIHAWIYNPDHALMKGMSKRAALYELHCEAPEKCDLYKNCNSCLLQSGTRGCKFGRKTGKEGPTKRARSYYTWISKARSDNEDYFKTLSTGNSYNRIFKVQNYWYLPYSFMSGIWGDGYPLKSDWVSEDEMTTDLLEIICTAKPRSMMGPAIEKYQNEVVPKFLHDVKTHYPELFDLLSDIQKSRVKNINFIGRKADISTCAIGKYKMGTNYWEWDGKKLIGGSMLFQPASGKIRIEIEPEQGQPVMITSNDQVTPETLFLD